MPRSAEDTTMVYGTALQIQAYREVATAVQPGLKCCLPSPERQLTMLLLTLKFPLVTDFGWEQQSRHLALPIAEVVGFYILTMVRHGPHLIQLLAL